MISAPAWALLYVCSFEQVKKFSRKRVIFCVPVFSVYINAAYTARKHEPYTVKLL